MNIEDPTLSGVDYASETASLSDDDRKEIEMHIANHINWLRDIRNQEFDLPETVKLLTCENGTKVYLIGTAHFSEESVNDVKNIMDKTNPDFVVIEMCQSRSAVVMMDEEKIKHQLKDLSLSEQVKMHGISSGILRYLLLQLNGHLISKLGMAPGGEFRAAVTKALEQPHCHVILGDRPINITLHRALNNLGAWQKVKFFFTLLRSFEPITKEDVEEMKKSDIVEKLVAEMTKCYPELTQTLIDERDLYLTRSIWESTGMIEYQKCMHTTSNAESYATGKETVHPTETAVRERHLATRIGDSIVPDTTTSSSEVDRCNARYGNCDCCPSMSTRTNLHCCPQWPPMTTLPRVVVAVVGIGHIAGIQRLWSTADAIDKTKLCQVMDPPLSWKLVKYTFRALALTACVGLGYGLILGTYNTCRFIIRMSF